MLIFRVYYYLPRVYFNGARVYFARVYFYGARVCFGVSIFMCPAHPPHAIHCKSLCLLADSHLETNVEGM